MLAECRLSVMARVGCRGLSWLASSVAAPNCCTTTGRTLGRKGRSRRPGVGQSDLDALPDDWEPEEAARFLEHASQDRLSVLYELAAYGGLRRGELCGLRWSDVDADGTGIEVRQTIVELTRGQARPGDLICPTCGREHVGRLFKRPKSRVGRRWVPLVPPAQLALRLTARHKPRNVPCLGPTTATTT